MKPLDRGMENPGMCAIHPSMKLFNIVTWKEWHALVPRPNDEDEEKCGNKKDGND